MSLPDQTTVESNIRYLKDGETAKSVNLNRPLKDFISYLTANGGLLESISDISSFGSIHKSSYITNETQLVVNYDEGVAPSIGDAVASLVTSGNMAIAPVSTSKFYKAFDLNSGAASPQKSGKYIQYTPVDASTTTAKQGTISFWVYPKSETVHPVWNFGSANFPFVATYGGVTLEESDGDRILPVVATNYIEIGFDKNDKYFYAKFVGSGLDTVLAQETGSYPVAAEFSDKWYNLAVTWYLNSIPGPEETYQLNFYVNGDLIATNPFSGGFNEVLTFSEQIQVHTGAWIIDELRYDNIAVTDSEIFSWYVSDAPFSHRITGVITPALFDNVTANQLITAINYQVETGDFNVAYTYDTNTTNPTYKFLLTTLYTPTGSIPWNLLITATYNGDKFLATETYILTPVAIVTGSITITITKTFTYDNTTKFLSSYTNSSVIFVNP